jgi:hypothetical protein
VKLLDLLLAQAAEIVGHGDCAGKKSEAAWDHTVAGLKGDDLDHGHASFGDDETFTTASPLDKARELWLGLVDVDDSHRCLFATQAATA